MIKAMNLTKKFDDLLAVDHINAEIKSGSVFGLIGTNGAGKSTFLRLAAGILKADGGHVTIDGEEVFENIKAKKKFFYIPDDAHFFSNASPLDMMEYYSVVYEHFDKDRFHKLMGNFGLDAKRKLHTFSKGMKKQVSVILGICSNTDYLFCDETFDGLDPVMRRQIWSLILSDVAERGTTVLVSSHNLRELEDVCDHVGIMHHGQMLLERSLSDMQGSTVKLQIVPNDADQLPEGLEILHESSAGRMKTLIVRGTPQDVSAQAAAAGPIYYELIPLTLEEIFIYELGGVDYAVNEIIL